MDADEGFEIVHNTNDCDANSTNQPNAIEQENLRLRQTLDRLTEERSAHEKEISRLSKALSELQSLKISSQFLSKFSKEYQVKDILGIGTSGCVFEADNMLDECKYAVKRIAVEPNDDVMRIALREVRAMAKLDHPGIVRFYSTWIEKPPKDWQYDEDDEVLKKIKSKKKQLLNYKADSVFIYIQMQLCNYSLTSWLEGNTSPETRILPRMKAWFKQIVSAVAYIHANNFIHRDLKPCNILFAGKDRLQICDMGIVIERKMEDGVEKTLTRTGSGTEEYMSPEQRGLVVRLTSKSDVFTLGLIFTELCVVMDYKRKVEIFNNFRKGKSMDIFEDERISAFVGKLTKMDKNERPTCAEMLDDLFLS